MTKIKKIISHEDGVEKFYSHGSEIRKNEADGFLSFGYWNENTYEYHDSAENLVRFFLNESKTVNPEIILNVACGYGAESFRFFDSLKPQKMHCVDITKAHIDFANKKAKEMKLNDKLIFEKKDACKTGFPNETFSHILGIEGPAHFKTRMDFFKEAYRLLKNKGELLLTDITFDKVESNKNVVLKKITSFASKKWHMPKENWVDAKEYCDQLQKAGFKVVKFLKIGDRVFPHFAKCNMRLKSIKKAIKTRGLPIGIGLTIISWLLGYGYKNNVIDYVFVKAVKI